MTLEYANIATVNTKKRVLIVDDEPQIGKIIGLKLKLAGYDVASTTSGTEAIDLIRTQKFDVMLLDILMPEVNGFDVLDKVRTFSQIPVIVFTARQDIFEMAKSLGADDFISKSLNPDYLLEKIGSVLSKGNSQAEKL